MSNKTKSLLIFLVIFLASLFIQTRGLGITGFEHRSNDEFLYLKSTQEMVKAGEYFTPTFFGKERFEKPILFYWLVIGFYKLFGVSWISARLVSAFMGSLTVCLTWFISRTFFSNRVSLLSCILLLSTPLFFAHTRTAVPDMALNFFIVVAFFCLLKFVRNPDQKVFSMLFFLSCALGFMVKGFPALIPILALIIYALWSKNPGLLKEIGILRGLVIMAVIICPWFVYMINTHGQIFLNHVMTHEVENRVLNLDHGYVVFRIIWFAFRNFFYYLGIIWNNLAPWSLFLFTGFPFLVWKVKNEEADKDALTFLMSWFFAGFFLFVVIALEQYNIQYTAAILSSVILLEPFEQPTRFVKTAVFLRKFSCMFVFSVGYFIFGYFVTFFTQVHQGVVGAVVVLIYVLLTTSVKRSRSLLLAPFVLGAFIIVVTCQMSFFEKNRLSRISTLKTFADTINETKEQNAVIGIGRSIDPTKYRIFFDQEIKQGALPELFSSDKTTYMVVTAHQLKKRQGRPLIL